MKVKVNTKAKVMSFDVEDTSDNAKPAPLLPGTIVDNQLIVSNSLLRDTATCETKTFLTWVLRKTVEGEIGPMLLGSAAHKAWAVHFKGGTTKEAMVAFRKHYKAWALENIDPDDKFKGRLAWDNARKVMRYWLKANPIGSLPFITNPELVEVAFATPLDDAETIIIRGILDLLVRHRESKKLYVVDNKSTGSVNPWWLAGFKFESQLTGYIWGVGQQCDEEVVGGYINALEFSKLVGTTNPHWKCKVHGTIYEECQPQHVKGELLMVPRTPDQVQMWRQSAIYLANHYHSLVEANEKHGLENQLDTLGQEGMFSGTCKNCQFLDFCRNGRKPELVDIMLVDKPEQQDEYYA